jgi:hypothetical protein
MAGGDWNDSIQRRRRWDEGRGLAFATTCAAKLAKERQPTRDQRRLPRPTLEHVLELPAWHLGITFSWQLRRHRRRRGDGLGARGVRQWHYH